MDEGEGGDAEEGEEDGDSEGEGEEGEEVTDEGTCTDASLLEAPPPAPSSAASTSTAASLINQEVLLLIRDVKELQAQRKAKLAPPPPPPPRKKKAKRQPAVALPLGCACACACQAPPVCSCVAHEPLPVHAPVGAPLPSPALADASQRESHTPPLTEASSVTESLVTFSLPEPPPPVATTSPSLEKELVSALNKFVTMTVRAESEAGSPRSTCACGHATPRVRIRAPSRPKSRGGTPVPSRPVSVYMQLLKEAKRPRSRSRGRKRLGA